MNCIVVIEDDTVLNTVENYIVSTPFLKHIKSFNSPTDAINFLYANKVDLILLGIDKPNIAASQLATLFQNKVAIIFIANCSKYAIEGFELNAIDFLITPITFDRFLRSIAKAMELKVLKDGKGKGPENNTFADTDQPLFIKSGSKIYKVNATNILYLEKEGNYFNIHLLNNKKLLIRMNFFDVFRHIPDSHFIRIHKSYIINNTHIDMLDGQSVIIHNHKLPIGASYKQEIFNYMKAI